MSHKKLCLPALIIAEEGESWWWETFPGTLGTLVKGGVEVGLGLAPALLSSAEDVLHVHGANRVLYNAMLSFKTSKCTVCASIYFTGFMSVITFMLASVKMVSSFNSIGCAAYLT